METTLEELEAKWTEANEALGKAELLLAGLVDESCAEYTEVEDNVAELGERLEIIATQIDDMRAEA